MVGTVDDQFILDRLLSDCHALVSALHPGCQDFPRHLRTQQHPSDSPSSQLGPWGAKPSNAMQSSAWSHFPCQCPL